MSSLFLTFKFLYRYFKTTVIDFALRCSMLFFITKQKRDREEVKLKRPYSISNVNIHGNPMIKSKRAIALLNLAPSNVSYKINIHYVRKNLTRHEKLVIRGNAVNTSGTSCSAPIPICNVFQTMKGEIGSAICLTEVAYAINKADDIILFTVSHFGNFGFAQISYTYCSKRFY
jgi:hypothetical protein